VSEQWYKLTGHDKQVELYNNNATGDSIQRVVRTTEHRHTVQTICNELSTRALQVHYYNTWIYYANIN